MGDLLDGGIDGPYNETDPYAEIERLRSRLDQAEADRESYKDQMIRAQTALHDAAAAFTRHVAEAKQLREQAEQIANALSPAGRE